MLVRFWQFVSGTGYETPARGRDHLNTVNRLWLKIVVRAIHASLN